MPRNGSGSYSLPQPAFVPGTTISSVAMNSDLSDIATAITQSISSDGQTPITAPLKGEAGTMAAPAWTFNGDVSSGMYLPAVGEVGLAAGGVVGLKASSVSFTATAAAVAAGGSGYAVGDTITLTGGTSLRPTILTVSSLSGSAVASVTIADAGLYTTAPTSPVGQGSTSGSGAGATFTMTFGAANAVADLTGNALWTLFGASSFMAGAMQARSAVALVNYIGAAALASAGAPVVQGRLTVISGTANPSVDTTATTIFFTPYKGNFISILSAGSFAASQFSELSLVLTSNHLASQIYDVFAFLNGGAVTIGTGPQWNNAGYGTGARGTGGGTSQLALLNGILTNAVQIAVRNGLNTYTVAANQATYIGTIFIDSVAGQVSCLPAYGQSRKWGVWNMYNRLKTMLNVRDTTVTWSYAGGGWRNSDANANNSAAIISGFSEEIIRSTFTQMMQGASAGSALNGIGYNTVANGPSGVYGQSNNGSSASTPATATAAFDAPPFLGPALFNCLENAGGGASNFYGNTNFLLLVEYMA